MTDRKPTTNVPLLEHADPTSGDANRPVLKSERHMYFLSLYGLIVKNFHVKKRHYISLGFELVLPILFVVVFTLLKSLFDQTTNPEGWNTDYGGLTSLYGDVKQHSYSYNSIISDSSNICNLIGNWKMGDPTCSNYVGPDSHFAITADDKADIPKVHEFVAFVNSSFCSSFANYSTIFNSSSQLNDYVTSSSYGKTGTVRVIAAIEFHKMGTLGEKTTWDYSIRMNTTAGNTRRNVGCGIMVPTTATTFDNLQTGLEMDPQFNYFGSGFIQLQAMVDRYILNAPNNVTSCTTTLSDYTNKNCEETFAPQYFTVAPLPIRSFVSDPFYSSVITVLPLMYLMSFLFSLFVVLAGMVEEKELRIKEGLVIMGISENVITLSWYITHGLINTCLALVITIICSAGLGSSLSGIFSKSSPAVIFLFFLLFGLNVVSFCFAVSAFFSKSKVAGVVGIVLFFGGYFGFYGTGSASIATKTWLCLLPQIAFALGIQTIGLMETSGIGVTFGNMGETYGQFQFSTALLLMLIDFGLYTFVGWYLNKVWPREWGVTLPPYFLFMPSYWLPAKKGQQSDSEDAASANVRVSSAVETVPPHIAALRAQGRCIDIVNLRKEFDTPDGTKIAVDGLNLTMYEGQIFALLGHNGAGKTTTINMLSGMLPVSSGKATILGFDVGTQMGAIRQSMGLCPQHNVLYPDLTVKEHLELFARIKGMSGKTMATQVSQKIHEVGLEEKVFTLSKDLSGGMKRKLSVAIALLGDSRVVFLDEPTSGMDPYSRRFTWDVLRKNREGRIMVLTTHFMDEADLLGDRIGIMGEGQLRCCGSSLFLKQRYGQGYNLTLTKRPGCDVDQLTNLVTSTVNGSRLLNNVGTELTFQLPVSETPNFPAMLRRIESEKDTLGVQEYGMSVTTMEEIFIRVAREGDVTAKDAADRRRLSEQTQKRHSVSHDEPQASHVDPTIHADPQKAQDLEQPFINKNNNSATTNSNPPTSEKDMRPVISPFVQIMAVYKKRALCAKRDFKAFVCVVLVPLLLVLLGLLILKYVKPSDSQPSLTLDTHVFDAYPARFAFTSVNTDASISSTFSKSLLGCDVFKPDTSANATFRLWGWDYFEGQTCYSDVGYCNQSSVINYGDAQSLHNLGAASAVLLLVKAASEGWYSSPIYGAGAVTQLNESPQGHQFQYVAFQNVTSPHSAAIYVNIMNNAFAKTLDPALSIVTRNHPFPATASESDITQTSNAFSTTIFIMIGISFIPASMVAFVVREKEATHNSKHLQLLSGCQLIPYWFANLLWDLTSYAPFFVFVIILIKVFQIDALIDHDSIWALVVLFIGFGYAIVPFAYMWSFVFSSASGAQIWLVLINFVVNLFLTIVSFLMSANVLGESVHNIDKSLRYIYRLFPGFCVGDALYAISLKNLLSDILNDHNWSVFDWDVAGSNICFLFVYGTVYMVLVLVIDLLLSYPTIHAKLVRDPAGPRETETDVDVDVVAEEQRVQANPALDDAVVVRGLRKIYRTGKPAVRHVQFGIPKGECFGLLGINGAGKTTTMKMLTGDVVPSSGTASLAGFDVMTDLRSVRKIVGYCPQFDALTDLLTVREHLELYCRLKGLPVSTIPQVVNDKLRQLDLIQFQNKLAGTLSGGNRRKLSVAIALAGNPPIIFLDEPSTGMDPVARRFMWNVIAEVSTSSQQCTVILTTHAMEECEALCTQVAIMVGGRFRCLGNVQHLKERFGTGFTVDVKLRGSGENGTDTSAPVVVSSGLVPPQEPLLTRPFSTSMMVESNIIAFFQTSFPGTTVVERSPSQVVFRLPQENLQVSSVFETIESNKERLRIMEYSVSQATLEQIFNSFAKTQDEETSPAPGMVVAAPQALPVAANRQPQATPISRSLDRNL